MNLKLRICSTLTKFYKRAKRMKYKLVNNVSCIEINNYLFTIQ